MMNGNEVAPTTTVTPARVRLFQPTQRPRLLAGQWIETAWGRARVVGRLGQRHADLLEAILFVAERRRGDDVLELLVDPARVRRVLSNDRHSGQRIQAWLDELMGVVVEIQTPRVHVVGHLIDHVIKTRRVTRPNPLDRGKRHLWIVRLGLPLCELLRHDLPLHYDPAPIARLKYGISQAIARHILTHRQQPAGGWMLDGLIETVAGKISEQAMRDRRREARADAAGLRACGIIVGNNRVSVEHRPDGVEHRPDGVEHRPGAWSIGPAVAG